MAGVTRAEQFLMMISVVKEEYDIALDDRKYHKRR